jgi:hypothetical protein
MPLLPADARRALVVFSAGGREFRVGDVLSILPTDAAPATQEPRASDVDTALAAFRYQRDLISAEECEAWLAQRGLAYGDLADSLARRVAGGATADVDSAEIDALLSEAFDTQARELAAHAAVRCELASAAGAAAAGLAVMADRCQRLPRSERQFGSARAHAVATRGCADPLRIHPGRVRQSRRRTRGTHVRRARRGVAGATRCRARIPRFTRTTRWQRRWRLPWPARCSTRCLARFA